MSFISNYEKKLNDIKNLTISNAEIIDYTKIVSLFIFLYFLFYLKN